MPTLPPPLIADEHAKFMESGLSISVGGCNLDKLASVCRAIGCRVSADRRRVTVFISASQGRLLLEDVRATGAIAVVFSLPSTHRTLQLKGRDAMVEPLGEGDLQRVEAYRDGFVRELAPLGYDARLVRTFLACAPDDIVALAFTPSEAFSQTPGPHAGESLKAEA